MKRNILRQNGSFSQVKDKHMEAVIRNAGRKVLGGSYTAIIKELTIEAIGISKWTKTILVLQLVSCIVVPLPPSSPPLLLPLTTLVTGMMSDQSSPQRLRVSNGTIAAVKLHLPRSFLLIDSLPLPAVCPVSLSKQSVVGSTHCGTSLLHFVWTLVWCHSNQEDPASLCWAGRRRRRVPRGKVADLSIWRRSNIRPFVGRCTAFWVNSLVYFCNE